VGNTCDEKLGGKRDEEVPHILPCAFLVCNSGLSKSVTDCEQSKIDACTQIIERGKRESSGNRAHAYLLRGLRYVVKGELDRAIADFSKFIEIKPKDTEGYSNRAWAYFQKGEYDRAIADYSRLIEINPKDANSYALRASTYNSKGEYDRAIADYDKAIEINPKDTLAYDFRGSVYGEKGEQDRAIADYDKAIEIDPKDTIAYNSRGLAYDEKGEHDRAIADYDKSIEIDPKDYGSYYNRGLAYKEKGEPDRAIADFKQALALGDKEAAARLAELENPPPHEVGKPEVASPAASHNDETPVAIPSGKRVALVIGNSNYDNIGRLNNPANDAKLIADALKEDGFELVGDGPQLDLDKASLDRAVQDLGNRLQGADVGLFYYAGHGVQVRGANYLVPVNANPTKEADVDFQMLDANLVLRQMEGAGTRLNLVMLDACRNNPFGGRGLRATGGGLAQMRAPEGTLISFATEPGTVAQDGTDGDSPYTKALAEVIRTPGLDLLHTLNRVGLRVKKSTGGAQLPWYSSSPIEGEFYFKPGSSGSSSARAVAASSRRSPPLEQDRLNSGESVKTETR
jgi:tetratricopeptide (TPR) repeat protein